MTDVFELLKTIIEYMAAPLVGLIAYLYNGLKSEVKELRAGLTELELDVSKEYLTKQEFKEFEDKIFKRMDSQHNDLTNKFDKLETRIYSIISAKKIDNN